MTRRVLAVFLNALNNLTRASFSFELALNIREVLLRTGGIHQASLSAETNSSVEAFVLRRGVRLQWPRMF